MQSAPKPDTEAQRLQALRELDVLDTAAEAQFDALTQAASLACGVPISLVSLVDEDRQWFKSNTGLPQAQQTPRDVAFCAHAILQTDVFEVPDALADPRFADNPLVTGAPDIRFYAGVPLALSNGHRVGTLCVIDTQARVLTPTQRDILKHLGQAAVAALEMRVAARERDRTEAKFRALSETSPLGIYATDAHGACTYTNPQWQRMYGRTAVQSLGTGWAEAIHPDDRAQVFAEWQRCAQAGRDFDLVFRVRHATGEVRTVRSTARQTLDASGQRTGFVGASEDITERQRREDALRKARALLERVGRMAIVGGWEVDLLTQSVHWSDQTCHIHGVEPGHQPTMDEAIDFYAPEARPVIRETVETAMRTGKGWDLELPFFKANGQRIWVRTLGSVEFVNGQPCRLVGAFQDVTERRRVQDELARQHELLRVTLQSIGDAVITTDAQAVVTWLNPVAEKLTGWLNTEAQGRPIDQVFVIVNEHTREPAANPVQRCLAEGQVVGLASDTVLIAQHGQERGIEDSAAPIRNEQGEVFGAVLVFHDVTEQRRLSGEMAYRAAHDPLTGLVNREEFDSRLSRLLEKSQQDGSTHALMYVDLDQFKLVNDACGHSAGDQLLKQVAQLMGEIVRSRDTLARLGGDEFGVLLDHCTDEQALRVAQQLCDRMEEFRFLHDERRFRIGTSIGLVAVTPAFASTAAVMQAADAACYAAKEAGRNRVHTWFDTDRAVRERKGDMQWTTRIEQALDDNRFALYAQRIQALGEGGQAIHAEVLIRMIDADGSVIMPGAFLPAAERFHLASRIDRWVLREATFWLASLPDPECIQTLCINLSGQSIGDRAFHRQAMALLGALGPELCRRLCLEITETAAVTNMADAAAFVDQVRALGVRIALDDFGAGASSFGYLKTLKVDLIKIDGQFIKDLMDDPLDDAAVRCFVDVARVVGVQTVAEFVGNAALLGRVRELGIGYAQGFHLYTPSPIEQLVTA